MMKSNKKTNGKVEILIAEDSPTQAAQLAHLLEQHGYVVTTASNGREALALLARSMPTLIISDVVMPELDGYGLCKATKATEKWKHIPVTLVTGLSDVKDVIRGLECGADNFIRKPYDEKYLLSRIDYLLMNLELRKNQKMQIGVEITLGGRRYFINSDRQQILDLLISTYEQAVDINSELKLREKELAHSNQVLTGLYRIAEGLNRAVSEQEVTELALERAMELPGIQAGWIFLREGESGFRLAAAGNLPPALEAPGAMESDCTCRRRLLSGELDSVTNILECERLQEAKGDTRGLVCHGCVPLRLSDRALGLLCLVGPGKGLFSEDELKVLYSVGNHLAVALERARLREHLEKLVEERTADLEAEIAERNRIEQELRLQARRQSAVAELGQAAMTSAGPQVLFDEACRLLAKTLDTPIAAVLEALPGGDEVVIRTAVGWPEVVGMTFPARHGSQAEYALTCDSPVVVSDYAAETRFHPAPQLLEQKIVSGVSVVIPGIERPFGFIGSLTREPRSFSDNEVLFIRAMANIVAETIENQTTQEALRESEERHRSLFEHMQEGVAFCRMLFVDGQPRDFLYLAVNSAFETLTGLKNVAGKYVTEVIPGIEKSDPELLEIYGRVVSTGKPEKFEIYLRALEMWFSISVYSSEKECFVAVFDVITERRQAEERLRASEERFRALVESAPDAIVMADPDGRIVLANSQMERLFGYSRERILSQYVQALMPERFRAAHASHWPGYSAHPRVETFGEDVGLYGLRCDGSEFPLELSLGPLETEEGVLVIASIHDVTERLRSQEEHRLMEHRLEQAQRVNSLGRVAATIAHEFNNVLMGIQPFAEVISRRAGDDERISKAAEQISTSVRRGKRVTEEILRFARPAEPQLEVIDMAKWVAAIEPELRSVAGSSVQITVLVPRERLFARCDAAQMQQVVTNLVINARDAMPNGGAVTLTLATSTRENNLFISLSEHERFVQLTVRDAGSGIAPEMLEQIFEPLFTTKRSGTGLGLTVARQVVTQHGGFIFAENAPGGGTAFHIFLPQVDEALSTAVPVAAQKTNGRIRRLLLVEDEVSVAAGLCSLLELEEIVVRMVGLGREVVRAIEEFAPDAVVLDLTLPDIDGREVFAQIVAHWPDLPVVFSTGHGSEADLARELSRDHVGFLRKPYEVAALMAAIERVL